MLYANCILQSLRIKTSEKPVKIIFGQFLLVLSASFLLAQIMASSGIWERYTEVYHTAFEFTCIFVAITSFLVVWHIYDRVSPVDNLVGLGFIIVAVFDLFHVYSFPELNLYPSSRLDLNTYYWILGRLSEALILLATTMRIFQVKLNKWGGLFISLSFAFGTSYIILISPKLLPALLTQSGGVTTTKIILEYVVIALFLLSLYKLNTHDPYNHNRA